jgi:cytochrome c-type biogenesis protein CcmH/NrfG
VSETREDQEQHELREEEREFLLRSLDDLESERAAGNIDDETYERLHADYTARAAAAVRALRGGEEPAAVDPAPPSGRHRLFVVGGLVVFAAVAATVMAFALGARLPGGTVTGNSQASEKVTTKDRLQALEAAVRAKPQDAETRLALARFQLGQRDLAGALESFRVAAGLAPTNAEPFAYSGWIVRLQGFPSQALQLLDKAVQVDPSYPDAHFFRGYVLLNDMKAPQRAIPEFQQYLVAAPDSPLSDQVRSLLAEAVDATKTPTSTTTKP